nr:hypothetical protein CFP56_22815 [Quercus suber]
MAENGVAIPSDENDAPTLVSDASNSSTFDNEDYMSSDEEIVIDEEENEQKLEIEKIEEKKHEINKILDENEIVLEPKAQQHGHQFRIKMLASSVKIKFNLMKMTNFLFFLFVLNTT